MSSLIMSKKALCLAGWLLSAMVVGAAGSGAQAALPTSYTIVEINPGGINNGVDPTGVLDDGTVVGAFTQQGVGGRGFVYKNNTYTVLEPVTTGYSGTYSRAAGICPNGDVYGSVYSTGGNYLGAVWRNGTLIADSIALEQTWTCRPDGWISAMKWNNSVNELRPYLYKPPTNINGTGTYIDLVATANIPKQRVIAMNLAGQLLQPNSTTISTNPPMGTFQFSAITSSNVNPVDMNRDGIVVGYSHTNLPPDSEGNIPVHAFMWHPYTPNSTTGYVKDLGTLGGVNSYARAVNAWGIIIGHSQTPTASRGFISDGGPMVDLNTLLPANSGWVITSPQAISPAGIIVGVGFKNGVRTGFMLTPVF